MRAPLAQTLVRDGGAGGEGDDDAVAQARDALDELLVEALPEGQEEAHRHGPPDDAEDRQEGPELLAPQVPEELASHVDDRQHGILQRR